MKSRTFLKLMFVIFFSGFTNMATGQDYTYALTVISLGEKEKSFDVEVSSKTSSSSGLATVTLSNQTTPFEKILNAGEHVVTVIHPKGKGLIESKITGILEGDSKGWASSNGKKAILKAGPGGRYSASE